MAYLASTTCGAFSFLKRRISSSECSQQVHLFVLSTNKNKQGIYAYALKLTAFLAFLKKKLDISIIYYLSTLVFDYFSILVINCCICVS